MRLQISVLEQLKRQLSGNKYIHNRLPTVAYCLYKKQLARWEIMFHMVFFEYIYC